MGIKKTTIILFALFLLVAVNAAAFWNATGGAVSYDGAYTIHTFLTNGTFNISENITSVSLLVVGGGGYGGQGAGGGGGVIYYNANFTISSNTNVIMGATRNYGGAGSTYWPGFNSSFGSVAAMGGGSGGYNAVSNFNGSDSATGGGGSVKSLMTTFGGRGIAGQGFAGGGNGGYSGDKYPAGGGGGSGQIGQDAQNLNTAGNGGNGRQININGTFAYYGGGGGGAIYIAGGVAGTGGLGGGGNGAVSGIGSSGVNGLGGGGGGGTAAAGDGGNGGSGVIIIRYLTNGTSGNITPPAPPTNITLTGNPGCIIQNSTYAFNWTASTGQNVQYNQTINLSQIGFNANLQYNFTASNLGHFFFSVQPKDDTGQTATRKDSPAFQVAAPSFSCSAYAACSALNLSVCMAAADSSCLNRTYAGNLSAFNAYCQYNATAPPGNTTAATGDFTDLNTTQGQTFLFILIFAWLALMVISFIFHNFGTASLMWLSGALIGIYLAQVGYMWAIGFLLLDTAIFLGIGKLKG